MDYERISVAIRERTSAEAIDMGFALARHLFPVLFVSALLTTLPIGLGSYLLLRQAPIAALALFWWLVPVYERLPLLVASRAFFGEPASVFALARLARPGALLGHLAGDLTWRRFSPWRSYLAPVRLLEALAGAALSRRVRAVTRSGRGAAAWLAAAMLAFEIVGWVGLLVFASLFGRQGDLLDAISAVFGSLAGLTGPLPYALFVATVTLLTPFSVCAGFALYINRRVALEGWDIELVFRRLARRLKATGGTAPRVGAAVAFAFALGLGAAPAHGQVAGGAAAAGPAPDESLRVARAIEEVLADKEFGSRRERVVWRPRWSRASTAAGSPARIAEWLAGVATFVADAAPWVLGAGAVLALGWLVAKGRTAHSRKRASSRVREVENGEAEVLYAGETVPEDWPDAACRSWQAGDPVRALSLLYRGTLLFLVDRRDLLVPASLTESECLRVVRDGIPESAERALFERVAHAWLRAAYAQAPPPGEAFEGLLAQAAGLIGGTRPAGVTGGRA